MQLNHLHPRALQPAPCLPSRRAAGWHCQREEGTSLSRRQLPPHIIAAFIPACALCTLERRLHGQRRCFHGKRRYRTPINGRWPIRIRSISVDEQKSSLLTSRMQVALLERARPENQDAGVSSPAFPLCDLLRVFFFFFITIHLLSLLHIIIPMRRFNDDFNAN